MSKEQKIYTEIFKGIEAISDLQFENRKLFIEKKMLEEKLKAELTFYKRLNFEEAKTLIKHFLNKK